MTSSLTLVRAIHFGSCLLLEAVFAVLFLVVVPVWNQLGGGAVLCREKVERGLRRMLVVCLVLALVSGVIWLWLAIAGMNDSGPMEALHFELFWMVLWQTTPGQVWLVRLGMGLVLAVTLFFLRRGPVRFSPAWLLGGLSATLLTASLAWLGHAGAGEGPEQNLQLAGDVLHLIAAGLWPGGLAPLALFLGCYLGGDGELASLLVAGAAVRRFSALSLVAVGLLVISGIANSYFLVGSFHTLVTSNYGRLLLLKLGLFLAMMVFGAWNLFLAKRRMLDGKNGSELAGSNAALAVVARNVWIEIVLGTVILLVVGLLGILPPAAHS